MPLPAASGHRAAASSATSTLRPPAERHARPAGVRILASVLLVIIGYSMSLSALAQPRAGGQAGYFVDFRSRPGYLFGHTSLFMAGSTGAASRATLTSPASTPSTAKPD